VRQFDYTIKDPNGLDADPAVLLGKQIKALEGTKVIICKDGSCVCANKLMSLVGLKVKCGDKITVKVEGGDEDRAVNMMETFMKEHL